VKIRTQIRIRVKSRIRVELKIQDLWRRKVVIAFDFFLIFRTGTDKRK
jgi:hypothetical protein